MKCLNRGNFILTRDGDENVVAMNVVAMNVVAIKEMDF